MHDDDRILRRLDGLEESVKKLEATLVRELAVLTELIKGAFAGGAPAGASPKASADGNSNDPLETEYDRLRDLIGERKRAGATREELRDLGRRREAVRVQRDDRQKERAEAHERQMEFWLVGLPDRLRHEYEVLDQRCRAAFRDWFRAPRPCTRQEKAARRAEWESAEKACREFEALHGAPPDR